MDNDEVELDIKNVGGLGKLTSDGYNVYSSRSNLSIKLSRPT